MFVVLFSGTENMLIKKNLLLGCAALSVLALSSGAQAQDGRQNVPQSQTGQQGQFDSLFSRDRNTSVLQRPRPEYEPLGIRARGFIVRPKVDLGIGYTDNVFAVNSGQNGQFGEQDDFYFVLRPSVTVESNWNRNSLVTGAYVETFQHLDFDRENVVNGGVFLDGRIDISRNAAFILGGAYDALSESRQVSNGADLAREPVEYDRGNLYGGIEQEFGRIRYRGRLGYTNYDYDNAISALTGNPIGQDFRDRDEIEVLGQVGYALTRDASVFIRGTYRERDYDNITLAGLNRNSEGYSVSAGVDFDISRLARGTVALGYLEESFDDPTLDSIDGLSAEVGVEYFPTELTTIGLRASRSVRASALVGAAGFAATDVVLNVDQEVARNIILSGAIGYGRDEYENINREDERYFVSVGGKWLINRVLSAKLEYVYTDQESNTNPLVAPFAKEFTSNELLLTLTAER